MTTRITWIGNVARILTRRLARRDQSRRPTGPEAGGIRHDGNELVLGRDGQRCGEGPLAIAEATGRNVKSPGYAIDLRRLRETIYAR